MLRRRPGTRFSALFAPGRIRKKALRYQSERPFFERVGVAGFEPTASSSRTTRATGLRYTPNMSGADGAAPRRESKFSKAA